jgi:hypothetical protein
MYIRNKIIVNVKTLYAITYSYACVCFVCVVIFKQEKFRIVYIQKKKEVLGKC